MGLFADLLRLRRHVPASRMRQISLVLALMLAGAVAELVSLGAILPFLALLADPEQIAAFPLLKDGLDAIGFSEPQDAVVFALSLFSVAVLVAAGIRLVLTWASHDFVFQVSHDLARGVCRRALYQPYLYHTQVNTGELIAVVNKVDYVATGVLWQLMNIMTAAVISAFIIIALILIDPVVALASAAGLGLMYAAVNFAMRARLKANGEAWTLAEGERVRALQESLGGIRDVLLDHTQESFIERFARIDAELRRAQTSTLVIGAVPRFIIEAAGMVLIAGVALVVSQGEGGLMAVLPVLGALALGAQRLLPLLQQIYSGWAYVQGNRQSLSDVLAVLDLPVEAQFASAAPERLLAFRKAIAFDAVGFRYGEDRPPALTNVSFRIEKGSRIGIIGKTGSGKSTVVDLVLGLLRPSCGLIRIDGDPLRPENIADWQAQIAHVPQSIYLADGSIAANIAFAVPPGDIDMARVKEAARHAEIADFIESLPQGYGTLAGERGIRLSGGQRQRLGIARALYKTAAVLVLDEATNALDSETEAAVMASVSKLARDLTIIVVAHRPSALTICDAVIVLEEGRVVTTGSFNEAARIPKSSPPERADGRRRA